MPLTILDPNTAPVVNDLQKGLVNGYYVQPRGEVNDNIRNVFPWRGETGSRWDVISLLEARSSAS